MKVELAEPTAYTDLSVANAARRSYNVEHTEFRTDRIGPRTSRGRSDQQLLWDLIHETPIPHVLPFRHPHITLSCDAPVPVARQLGKHQVGLDWSEVSRRYKIKDIVFYRIGHNWRAKIPDQRQGTGPLLPHDDQLCLAEVEKRAIEHSIASYEEALHIGACPEQARFLLLQGMEVSWTWTGSLLAWFHLWNCRHHQDTQQETREFAHQVGDIMGKLFPYSWWALTSGEWKLPDEG